MLASFSAYLASFVLFYAVPRFWVYALAMILFAIGETFRSGTHKAMILEYLRMTGFEDEKVAYYGHTRAASQFGSAVASLIAAGLVFYVGGYRIVFLASTVPYALALVLFLTYPKALDGERQTFEGGLPTRAWHQFRWTTQEFLKTLRRPALLRGLLSGAGFDALFRSSKDYLQPILQAQALALPILLSLDAERRVAVVVGALYFLIYLVTSIASSRAGVVEQRMRSLPRAANLTFAAGLGLLAVAGASAWAGVPGIAIAGFLLLYATQNVRRPLIVGYLADLLTHRTMATGLSVETQLRTLLAAALAPLLGFLADRFGIGMGLIALTGAAALAFPLVRIPPDRTCSRLT
jgi:hypothetical protein